MVIKCYKRLLGFAVCKRKPVNSIEGILKHKILRALTAFAIDLPIYVICLITFSCQRKLVFTIGKIKNGDLDFTFCISGLYLANNILFIKSRVS